MSISRIIRPVIEQGLQDIYNWYAKENSLFLKSIFSLIGFKGEQYKIPDYYLPPEALSFKTVLPEKNPADYFLTTKQQILTEILEQHQGFSQKYLESLHSNQLYFLLETYGLYIPSKEDEYISLFDACKVDCAEAVIQNKSGNDHHRVFIHFDISGIQSFIYNIISKGALKNLRSRSFFIELLSHHVERQILSAFDLHQSNIIINSGGSGYILCGKTESYNQKLAEIDYSINSWLLKEFNTRLHVSLVAFECTREEIASHFYNVFSQISQKTFAAKHRKFETLLRNPQYGEIPFFFISLEDPHNHQCAICRNDAQQAHLLPIDGKQDQHQCSFCNNLIRLGNSIPDAKYIYMSDEPCENSIQIDNSRYLLSEKVIKNKTCSLIYAENSPAFFNNIPKQGIITRGVNYITRIADLDNNVKKTILEEQNQQETFTPLKETDMAQLTHFAKEAGNKTSPYIGALRMDADNIGRLAAQGFYNQLIMQRLLSFSRQMNLFFKLTVPYICKGKKVQLIYAGGDDLFLLGAWNDVMQIACEAGQQYSKYTCNNIDIGISAGLTIHDSKFPVSDMAQSSKKALDTAKANQKSCWECRKDFEECPLFNQGSCLRKDSFAPFYTEWYALQKRLLDDQVITPYEDSPSRLVLALKWKVYDPERVSGTKGEFIHEVDDYLLDPYTDLNRYKHETKTARVFFHKVLSLLNTWYTEGVMYLPRIAWLLQKMHKDLSKIKTNQEGETLFHVYDQYLHLFDPHRFATLHMPLNWLILSQKQGDKHETAV